MADRRQVTEDWVEEAERVRDELRDALGEAGVTLPSLALDAASCAGSAPLALIDLGRCNVATARALTVAVRPVEGDPQEVARGTHRAAVRGRSGSGGAA